MNPEQKINPEEEGIGLLTNKDAWNAGHAEKPLRDKSITYKKEAVILDPVDPKRAAELRQMAMWSEAAALDAGEWAVLTDFNSDRNQRFSRGEISEEEIRPYWDDPYYPIFRHELKKKVEEKEMVTRLEVRPLTQELLRPLVESLKDSWYESDEVLMRETLEKFLEQKKLDHPGLLNVEYYVTSDLDTGKPIAINGIFTVDIQGGRGLGTKDRLDPERHYMTTLGAWTAVKKEYQGRGIGRFLINLNEKLGQSRGADIRAAETDTWETQKTAIAIYKKMGLKQGFHVPEFYGPGRDLHTYYTNVDAKAEIKPFRIEEQLLENNKQEVLNLARQTYSPEKYEEFEVCLDLVLSHKPGEKVILEPRSFVLRGKDGKIESFSIMSPHIYGNTMFGYWYGVKPGDSNAEKRLMEAMQGLSKQENRGVLIVLNDSRDLMLERNGFMEPKDGVPEIYEKGDKTEFLFFTKRLK